jgi:hypothetical protein
MASRQFFDPLVLLRVAPLVTTSASLWYSVDQFGLYTLLLGPRLRETAAQLLPGWWQVNLAPGLAAIFGLYGVSIGAGVANLLYKGGVGASRLYGYGAAFALSHFLFVPAVMYKIKAMVDDEPKGEAPAHQRRWLNVHVVRSLISDLPGFLCFLFAVTQSLKVV